MIEGKDWARLAERVVSARVKHGMRNRRQLATASGFSARVLGDIEKARRDNYGPETLAMLEQALGWLPGSVNNILAGGEPITANAAVQHAPPNHDGGAKTTYPDDEAIIRVMRSPDVPEDAKPAIIAILLEDREREQQRRLALAESLLRGYRNAG